jgi:hypothetical protein
VYYLFQYTKTKLWTIKLVDVLRTTARWSAGIVQFQFGALRSSWEKDHTVTGKPIKNTCLYSTARAAKRAVPKGGGIDKDAFGNLPRSVKAGAPYDSSKSVSAKAPTGAKKTTNRAPIQTKAALIPAPPVGLLGVVHARKYRDHNGLWNLVTKAGMLLATFATESDLEAWWQRFQTSQGRKPNPLVNGQPIFKKPRITGTPRIARKLRRASATPAASASGNPVGSGYLAPWSAKYNMPEFDLE